MDEGNDAEADAAWLVNWWRGLAAGDALPRRETIDACDIQASILPRILLLDCADPENFTYRLAGTGIRDIVGFEISGKRFRDVFPEDDAYSRYLLSTVVDCLERGAALLTYGRFHPRGGTPTWTRTVLRLLLPFRTDAEADLLVAYQAIVSLTGERGVVSFWRGEHMEMERRWYAPSHDQTD